MRDGDGIACGRSTKICARAISAMPWTRTCRKHRLPPQQIVSDNVTRKRPVSTRCSRCWTVIRNSDRLTVLIFCDGKDAISGTPYDAASTSFQQRVAEQNGPGSVLIVLRTQRANMSVLANFPRHVNFRFLHLRRHRHQHHQRATAPSPPANRTPSLSLAPTLKPLAAGTSAHTNEYFPLCKRSC